MEIVFFVFGKDVHVNEPRVGFYVHVTSAPTFQKYLLSLFTGHINLDEYYSSYSTHIIMEAARPF
jgi:hypothetical protein